MDNFTLTPSKTFLYFYFQFQKLDMSLISTNYQINNMTKLKLAIFFNNLRGLEVYKILKKI